VKKLKDVYKKRMRISEVYSNKQDAYDQRSKVFYESMREYMVLKRF